jgi:hypothetical protein
MAERLFEDGVNVLARRRRLAADGLGISGIRM